MCLLDKVRLCSVGKFREVILLFIITDKARANGGERQKGRVMKDKK